MSIFNAINIVMEIFEFTQPVIFHKTLNPKLWDGENLREEVLLKLLDSAYNFLKSLNLDEIPLRDIIITGSNTNLTYTPHSDLDLHVIVDYSKIYNGSLVDEFFTAKKSLWNEVYDPEIYGIPVEVYAEDTANPVKGNSYSLLTREWLVREPIYKTQYNDRSVKAKASWLEKQLKRAIQDVDSLADIARIKRALKRYRQSGLDKYGEFSTENLVFKSIRNGGWLNRLRQREIDLVNTQLSLK